MADSANTKSIPLTQGKIAIIDEADFEWLNQWKWNGGGRYATRTLHRNSDTGIRKTIYMHKLIMDNPIGFEVDHINGNTLDNRRSNLRVCTHQENSCNRKRNKNSPYGKGIRFYKDYGIWGATINYKGDRIFLGIYQSQEDAILAYNSQAIRLHGNFARITS